MGNEFKSSAIGRDTALIRDLERRIKIAKAKYNMKYHIHMN